MAVTSGQVPVSTGGTVLTRLSAGPGSVTISNGGTALIYVGVSSTLGTLSPTGGMPVPSGGIFSFQLFAGSPAYNLVAVATGGTSTAGFIVSDAQGGLPQLGVI
jgi:hypothetical protein